MKERVQEQISSELKQASRMDTTILIIGIVLTLILFGMAIAFAEQSVNFNYNYVSNSGTQELIVWATAALFISLIALVIIDLYSVFALRNNIKRKTRLAENLAKIYQEEGAPSFPGSDISAGYRTRGNLFMVILAAFGAACFIVPLIVFINKIVEQL